MQRGTVGSGCSVACVSDELESQGLSECSESFLDGSFAAAKEGGLHIRQNQACCWVALIGDQVLAGEIVLKVPLWEEHTCVRHFRLSPHFQGERPIRGKISTI